MATEQTTLRCPPETTGLSGNADRSVATVGALVSVGALFSAAACCILPLALAAIGVGSAGLSSVVPFHWPLTIAAMVAVVAGWLFYLRKRNMCGRDVSCAPPPAKSTFVVLCVATVLVTTSTFWGFIEAPLMGALGGV